MITSAKTESSVSHCTFLGDRLSGAVHECAIFGKCSVNGSMDGVRQCLGCPHQRSRLAVEAVTTGWEDPLLVKNRHCKPCEALRGMLAGGSAFLVCGGPSLNEVPKDALAERGVFSLAVNNAAAHVPASAFVCSDPPTKFHNGIFEDPKVIKFLPFPKLDRRRGTLRMRMPDGSLQTYGRATCDCPNVWGFERRGWLQCDETWFTEKSAAWGNLNEGVARTGEPKTACTMLLGLRLLQYLGARRVFLLGVDFRMDATRGGPYAFSEDKSNNACNSNNRQFERVNNWLTRLRPVFEQFGFETYNCNRQSHLRAFDYVPFDVAIEHCRGHVPPGPWDLQGWYRK